MAATVADAALGPAAFGPAALALPTTRERRALPRWLAIVAALLLHLAVAALILIRLPEAAPAHPPAIPVQLRFLPPPAPKLPPAVKPAAQPSYFRRSGPDQTTTTVKPTAPSPPLPGPAESAPAPVAPKRAPQPKPEETKAPAQSAPASSPPAPAVSVPSLTARQGAPLPLPQPKPAPPPPPRPVAKSAQAAAKPAPRRRMASLPPHPPEERGDRERTGDPYLNALRPLILEKWHYPPLARTLGLTGTTVLDVLVGNDGRILGIKLVKSAGADILDRSVIQAIRDAAPLPPPPPPPNNFPGAHYGIVVTFPVGPSGR